MTTQLMRRGRTIFPFSAPQSGRAHIEAIRKAHHQIVAARGPDAVDELLGSFASATDRVGRIAWIRERFKLEDDSGAAAA